MKKTDFEKFLILSMVAIFPLSILSRAREYSRVHISSDTVFFKILKKPSIVQKWMILYMSGILVFIEMKLKKFFFSKKKKIKMANFKKTNFQLRQFSIFFHENFIDWFLGL